VYLLKYPTKRLSYYLHALACATTFGYLHGTKMYHYYGAAFLTWEASTPFLYGASIMTRYKYDHTMMYKLNALMFTLTFFVFRIVFGTYVVYVQVWPQVSAPWRCVAVTLTGLNYYWFSKILRKFRRLTIC
jgi:hypothetical protein